MFKIFIYPIYLDEEFDLNQLIKNDGLESFALHFYSFHEYLPAIKQKTKTKVTLYFQDYSLIITAY